MTFDELRKRQSWTLSQKVDHSLGVIDQFINKMGVDSVYVSFSGGKDSTVLLNLARMLYPDILAVFCNTGNEYPDIVSFVRQTIESGVNVNVIRPHITPREVWSQFGFPLISKEVSQMIHGTRFNPDTATSAKRLGKGKYSIPHKWRFLLSEPYAVSHRCCEIMKKKPFHKFEKETGRHPILGTMAAESRARTVDYIRQGGCNQFNRKTGVRSLPLAIWTEEDIWEYIAFNNISIAEIYNKGATRTGCMGCGFGCHVKGDIRFELLRREYPKCYDMVMAYQNNGVTFKEAVEKVMSINGAALP